MATLIWDEVGSRVYETGLDRGVLYLSDGSAVPWNGLTSIIEKYNIDTSPVYFDGMKITDLVSFGDFSATMKAMTYPDEFIEIEGYNYMKGGVLLGEQAPQTFGLCYRTQIGNDVQGNDAGYKIHVLYNVTAIPSDRTYASLGGDTTLVEFEWEIVAVPEEVPGFHPTAHIIINSKEINPWLLHDIEEKLYGSSDAAASLIPMADLVTFIRDWYSIQIVYNGDGTWTAYSERDGYITVNPDGYFTIDNVLAVYLDNVTYQITTTDENVPVIVIKDNRDGTWTASSDFEELIVINDDGTFTMYITKVTFINDYTYTITDAD